MLCAGLIVAPAQATAQAAAQAQVQVVLKDKAGKAAEGEVTLKDADGKSVASCTAGADGRCEMSSVPGGSYKVHVKPKGGEPPKPKSAMIPPEGKVTLHVSTGS